jgi:diguanylate cyclase (GGDEF)-like protein/PAS domain S-box-containing protein
MSLESLLRERLSVTSPARVLANSARARSLVGFALRIALVAAVYYVAARLSLKLSLVGGQVTPIWPPTGIAVVALLRLGRRVWPAVALAAFLVNAPISSSLLVAAGIAAGNTIAPLLAATLLRRADFRPELDRLRDALAIVFVAALLSMTVSATLGTIALAFAERTSPVGFWATWSVWWTGDAMGVLVVAPFLLTLPSVRRPLRLDWRRWSEASILLVITGLVTFAVFHTRLRLEYLVFPLLGWMAWRFGQRGAAPAALLTSTIAIWAAIEGTGSFADAGLAERMVTLQVFNASVAFASFVFAALVAGHRQAQEELRQSEERTSGLLASAPDAIIVVGEDGRIRLANALAETMFDYGQQELIGLTVDALVPEGLRSAHARHRVTYLKDPATRPMGLGLDLAARRKDGTEFPVEIGLSSHSSAEGRMITCIVSDITERKRLEEEMAFLAYHDKLTGLANKARFDDHLEVALARAGRARDIVAVLCMDIDGLKLVNDGLGHAAGDELIAETASRLRSVARETDVVARQGGDEFLVLLADLPQDSDGSFRGAARAVEEVAGRIRDQFEAPFHVADTDLDVTVSVGISICPLDASDARTLLRNADIAMYRSKETGTGDFVLYAEDPRGGHERFSLVPSVRRASREEPWVLCYQPIVELASGSVVAAEALLRWPQPDGSLMPPGKFVPLAEELGLIHRIGGWVMREACRQAKAWQQEGLGLAVSFNLSPRQLWNPGLAEEIITCIEREEVDPRRVIVEITESAAMADPARTQGALGALSEAGLTVAIDDFGTGHSSLSRLKLLPVDLLKIDLSFLREIPDNENATQMMAAIVQLARTLGLTPVAEGVESEEQSQFLLREGCTLAQGYHLAPPVQASEVAQRLQRAELTGAERPQLQHDDRDRGRTPRPSLLPR